MIVFHEQQIVYLHVPRTGGTSLSTVVEAQVPGAQWIGGPAPLEHMPAHVARKLFPQHRFVAVIRNPWDVVRSAFCGLCALAATEPDWRGMWHDRAEFDRMVRYYRLGFGGFTRQLVTDDFFSLYGCGGFSRMFADERTILLRYEQDPYRQLGTLVGVHLDLPYELPSRTDIKVHWTDNERSVIAAYFHADALLYL
jgi:hypothetical protein